MTGPGTLDVELVPVEKLTEHPDNYNLGQDELVAELLRRFGQWRPAVVQRSTGRVLVGNTMLRAARDLLGWDSLNVHWRDVDDDDALRILAGDNRSSDLHGTDDAALAALLARLDATDDGLAGTLYARDDLGVLLASLADPPALADFPTDDRTGDGDADPDLWPTLAIRLLPILIARWKSHRRGFASDQAAFAALLDAVGEPEEPDAPDD